MRHTSVMRYALLGTLLLITATAGLTQNRPSLTWEGEVDGTALLMIRGDRVDVDTRTGGAVTTPNYRFRTPLADDAVTIEVENRLGGARVRILEQPRRNNNFTAVVEIATRSRGMQRVSLDFYWDDAGRISRNRDDRYRGDRGYGTGTRSRTDDRYRGSSATAHWSGEVDNEVFVLMRGRQFFSTSVRGRAVYGQQVDVTSPLPRRAVDVVLQDVQGRGRVELAEQPDASNNFTAKIRILDPETGAGSYSFSLAWDESGRNTGSYSSQQNYPNSGVLSPGGSYEPSSGTAGYGVRWAGQVDGRVRVSFRDNQAYAQRLSGQNIVGEQVSFSGPVPRRNVDVEVNKLRGRGDVHVVQRPSPNNNYTLVVEIDDSDGGADVYDLQIVWR